MILRKPSKPLRVLGSLVDSAILQTETESRVRHRASATDRKVYPSMITNCSRMVYYFLEKAPEQDVKSPKGGRIMDNGHKMHERYYRYFEKAGILIERDFPVVNEDLWLKGEGDAVVKINNELYIVELKSMNTNKFKRLSSPLPAHVEQTQLYMYCKGIHKGIILYEDKNDQENKEFHLTYDTDFVHNLVNRIREIQSGVQTKLPPPRICNTIEDGKFRFCTFAQHCFSARS